LGEVVELPTTLSYVGLDVNDDWWIRAIAERTVVSGETSHHGVVEVTADMVGRCNEVGR
jgi:hypothetical protein